MVDPATGGDVQWVDLAQATEHMRQAFRELLDTGMVTWHVTNYTTAYTTAPPIAGQLTELGERIDHIEARRREIDAQHEHYINRWARANEAGYALLMAHLSEQQRHDVTMHSYFEVTSSRGNRWRIQTDMGYSGNVHLMKPGTGDAYLAGFCAHASEGMTNSEHFLVQKLALETDEDQFVRVGVMQYGRAGWDKVINPYLGRGRAWW